MSEPIEFCDCGEAVTVYDKGDGITRHSRCDKPHYASYLATQLEESRKEIDRLKSCRAFSIGDDKTVHMIECENCKELEARVEELTEAIKPFAALADINTSFVHPEAKSWVMKAKEALNKSPQSLLTRRKLEGELVEQVRKFRLLWANDWELVLHKNDCKPLFKALDALDQGEGR